MRVRERTTAILLIAIFMVSFFAVAMPVNAQKSWGKPENMVSAIGHFTTNLLPMTDHRCFINLHAKHVEDGWTGKGVFRDRDYKDGKLVATFTVESTSYERLPYQVNYVGTADVYLNNEYVGAKMFDVILFMGRPGFEYEFFSFQLPSLGYYAFESGYPSDAVSVKLTVK